MRSVPYLMKLGAHNGLVTTIQSVYKKAGWNFITSLEVTPLESAFSCGSFLMLKILHH